MNTNILINVAATCMIIEYIIRIVNELDLLKKVNLINEVSCKIAANIFSIVAVSIFAIVNVTNKHPSIAYIVCIICCIIVFIVRVMSIAKEIKKSKKG